MISTGPFVTIVMRDSFASWLTSVTVRLSILYPRPANRPITRARTPGSLSTSTAIVCLSIRACGSPDGIAEPHSILFIAFTFSSDHRSGDDRANGLSNHHLASVGNLERDVLVRGLIAENHAVVSFSRWDHREAIRELRHTAIEDHRLRRLDHLNDEIVEFLGLFRAQAHAVIGFRKLHEIGQRFRIGMRVAPAVQEFLP